MQVQSLGMEDPLEEAIATHSSILGWRIPDREAGWVTIQSVAESDTIEVTLGCRLWGRTELDMIEAT